MSFFRSKRGIAAIAAGVILALFLVRPGADQLRARTSQAIGLALGRQVEISSVSLRLLPRPGFDLQNLVVHEDPAFGAEPTLRANEVTAALRLTSLLRGRLEIARLSFSEPSVNLVRNSAGHWNLESVLERAEQTHIAPTGKSKIESRPGFPYIEAGSARINFKFGHEKKPYTLTDADFSVWQDSEDTWGMRLTAQPVRTDFNLSDTGAIRIQGSWHRAASLRETPLQFSLRWQGGQLGQVTRLVYGYDQGWRGTVALSATLSGTPAGLAIRGAAAVDGFRRYDLDGGASLRLAAQCSARYAPMEGTLSEVACVAPVASGSMALNGNMTVYQGATAYDLRFAAHDVPMQSLVVFARHTKKDIPEDLAATGTLDAAFEFQHENSPRRIKTVWSGAGETRNFEVSSAQTGTTLALDKVPFSVSPGTSTKPHHLLHPSQPEWTRIAGLPHLQVGPLKLPLGRPAPIVVSGLASRSEYALSIDGDGTIQRLLQLARSVGLPTTQPNADGIAKVDLQIAGSWSAFNPPTTLGQAQLRSVRAEVRGVNQPLEIASADVALTPSAVEVKNLTASLAASTWQGSLALPRHCANPAECLVRFDLHTDAFATDEWSGLLGARAGTGPWYRLFGSNPRLGSPYLLALRATGRASAKRVSIRKLQASQVSAKVDLEKGILQLSDLEGDVLGGHHEGEWKADFTAKPPVYSGSGTFHDIDLGKLSYAKQDGWIVGGGSARYRATASGWTASELITSATASLQVEDIEGTLPHVVLESGAGPLQIRSFGGQVLLQDGKFTFVAGELDSPGGTYQVNGTASLSGSLNVKLTRPGAAGFSIVGPLAAPTVGPAAAAEARAALKP